MHELKFTKMTGAGNDFIIVQEPDISLSEEQIQTLCDRHFGIGGDGLMILYKSDNADFKVEYYNSDGKKGSLCGNGARCIVRYAFSKGIIKNHKTKFQFFNEIFDGEIISDSEIKVNLHPPKKIKLKFKIKASGQLITAHFVDIGSEHVIIYIKDILKNVNNPLEPITEINEIDVNKLGKEIRNLPEFPNGVNVNFIQPLDRNSIKIRTYERGVENETLACGTGSTSAAIIHSILNNILPPIKVITRSNKILLIDFKVENNLIHEITLSGPAEILFEGSYKI